MKNQLQKLKFPEGFLWGASTSSYQVEGGITNNDWAASLRVPKAGLACDSYNRYVEDFMIAKYLHHNAHRMSLEWARIEPKPGQFDENALYHYHSMLSWLKDNGFQTFVTLHHFTNPLWFAKKGGWEAAGAVKDFQRYTAKVAQSLGHLIDFWITVNEPMIYAGMAYGRGLWPPFRRNYLKSYQVYRRLLAAHNEAYGIIHNFYSGAEVGFAQNIACNEGGISSRITDYLEIDFAYNGTKNDFLGLNHYFYRKFRFGARIKNRETADWPIFPIYPRALFEVLMKLKKYRKPIYITENGLPDEKDLKRERYIKSYLAEINRAIEKGAKVKGYLHWSLLDNYEWAEGYKYKFGLVAVDFKTQKRTIRESAFAYSHICQDNAITVLAPLEISKTDALPKNKLVSINHKDF